MAVWQCIVVVRPSFTSFPNGRKKYFLEKLFRKPKNGAKVYERYPSGIWIYVCFYCFPNDGKY